MLNATKRSNRDNFGFGSLATILVTGKSVFMKVGAEHRLKRKKKRRRSSFFSKLVETAHV